MFGWVLCVLLVVEASLAIHLKHDLENYMQDLDFMEEDSSMLVDAPDQDLGFEESENAFWSAEGDEGVRRMWGVPDTSVSIGELLSYQIPKDAFVGPVERYIVKGKESPLPSWMHFDEETNTLEGIPTGTDIGAHFVKVFGVGPSPGSKAKDTFVVEVMPSVPSVSESQPCSASRISVLNLLLDASLGKLNGKQRVALLRKMSRFLPVPEKQMRLIREEDLGSILNEVDMSDSGMVGPGDSPRRTHNGAVLQWQVGCDGEVANEKALRNIAESAKDGTLHEVTGYPVVGWYINAVNILLSRESREVGSGDHDPYEDATDEMPASRQVPSLATPVHPEQPVSPHPHRHGHEIRNSATPAYYVQPTATPTLVPIMPTSVMGSNFNYPEPTMSYPEDLSSSMTDSLEPSLVYTPPVDATETEPLASDVVASTYVHPSSFETTYTGTENFPPSVAQRLAQQTVAVGHEFRFQIPEGIFEDFENNKLELQLKDENHELLSKNKESWLQFDREKQEMYGLALQDGIGKWVYHLYAYDERNRYANESVIVRIQQASNSRKENHLFNLTFTIQKDFDNDVLWKLEVLHRLAKLFGDNNTEHFMVEAVTAEQNSHTMSWRNFTLMDGCPREDIISLYKVLSHDSSKQGKGKPTKALIKELGNAFKVKSVSVQLNKQFCDGNTIEKKPSAVNNSIPPVLENQIDEIPAVAGELLSYIVPQDTFHDTEDGGTDKLNLTLTAMEYGTLNKASWLQFDSRNREFYGIPLESDIGTAEYNLKCTDQHGNPVSDALQVIVKPRNDSDTLMFNAQFSITIDHSWDAFNSDGNNRVNIVKNLATAFDDTSSKHIVVKSIAKGSVIFTWYNRSLPVNVCPAAEIERLRRVMLREDSQLTDSFKKIFQPVFLVISAEVKPMGICLGGDTPTDGTIITTDGAILSPRGEQEDHLITYIVPAIVIAIMILIAAIIAFILYRKRSRQGKMTMVDNKTYLSKGIPIIFAEELEDKPEPPKNPVIMKDEKPPLPPPEYPRGTPKPERGEEELEDYQPPPPFTANRDSNRQNRPKATPTYRKPPPYVPP